MRRLIIAVFLLFGLCWVSPSQATLPPVAYEQLRNFAPIALIGTVQNDPGGYATLRVEQVGRGFYRGGQLVAVIYPLDGGVPVFPGPEVRYRRFNPGMRLRIFAQPGLDGRSIQIVHGGIDVMAPAPNFRPKRRGCASCTVGSATDEKGAPAAAWVALAAALAWLRRRGSSAAAPRAARDAVALTLDARRAVAACAVAAYAVAACAPAAPTQVVVLPQDGPEIVTEGKSDVTVLSRPDGTTASQTAAPKAMSTDACRASDRCASSGECSYDGKECIVGSYADCEQTSQCHTGVCSFADSRCVVHATCEPTHGCKQAGRCAMKNGMCVVSSAGCAGSEACKTSGRCTASDGACIASTNTECKDSSVCAEEARCTADAGVCIVESDQACKSSPACAKGGRCLVRDGKCVKSCAESSACADAGRCGERAKSPRSCVALTDAACDKSTACKLFGFCSVGLKGRCVAGDDVECRMSRTCTEDGRCSHVRGRCVPGSAAECKKATVACKREGRCKFDAGRCIQG